MIDAAAFKREVVELHSFLERSFGGIMEPREIERLDVLDESFVMIGPGGRTSDAATVRRMIAEAHGRGPLEIAIRNVTVRPDASMGVYEEWQSMDGSTTARISTAVMSRDASMTTGLRWMHLHETWLPDRRP